MTSSPLKEVCVVDASNVRHLRRVVPPLASYLRVGLRDVSLMERLVEQGFAVGAGVILDPSVADRTSDLREVAGANGVEVILDTRGVELSTPGGFALSSVRRLPWAGEYQHAVDDFASDRISAIAESIACTATEQRASAVLALTHFLSADEQWLSVDVELAFALREALDRGGSGATAIYYPLVTPLRLLRDEAEFPRILGSLRQLAERKAIDGIFLRIQGFGTPQAGPRNIRSYVEVARRLHELGLPLVAEKTGCVGVALAAFGAVGGVESAITYGDSYDARRLAKPSSAGGFLAPRAYVGSAMMTLPVGEAKALLSRRGFARMACSNICCGSSKEAMFRDVRRHFIVSRQVELAKLSAAPQSERPEQYLTTMLGPARDASAQIARAYPQYAKHRDRLDDWLLALRRTHADDAGTVPTLSRTPTGHRFRAGA